MGELKETSDVLRVFERGVKGVWGALNSSEEKMRRGKMRRDEVRKVRR